MLHNEQWVCCVQSSVCVCINLLVCVFTGEIFIYACSLCYVCVYAKMWILSISMYVAAHPCGRIMLHSEKAYRIFTPSLRNGIFFLSLQLGETNRPVMQQWEALNAKHIIREEGSWEEEEEEEEGGRQKENWNWKRTRKDAKQQKKSDKWRTRDRQVDISRK